ncbi:BlaI/MecI/CopY family transcriptional regulator [Pleionea sediminis]|uniref:BlaI/MecI/CopY family transcriptional regulator n=1 Tax=Pleionea sediminis TaxID=2569479 RepID=UPI001185AFFE|nr:BlaI/MecI/CopY family transcriptional regulator [Pleionea sediminis]
MALSPHLGDLEVKVLEYLWEHSQGTAKSVHEQLSDERKISVNTVQSALERLYRKNLLSRRKQSHSYIYTALASKQAVLGQLINDMLGRFHSDTELNVAAIVNAAESIDQKALDILEAEIERRRSEGNE